MIEPVSIPEGMKGKWQVRKFTVSEEDSRFSLISASVKGRGYVAAGPYTQLTHSDRGIIMSDTPDERRDHLIAVHKARGHVLINGLGLGMVLGAILKKPDVTRVTVVEIDRDVIDLVGQHYPDTRVEIIECDAFTYAPPKGVRYGAVWHDIWDTICSDNLAAMTRLKRKYGRRTDWQGCWSEGVCRLYRKRGY